MARVAAYREYKAACFGELLGQFVGKPLFDFLNLRQRTKRASSLRT
jgi:hypothetical protein